MFVLFQSGNNEFGINMTQVQSIQPAGTIKDHSGGLQATVEIDNQSMPLCDLAVLTGSEPSSQNAANKRVLLVTVMGKTMALLVDKVDGVVEESNDQIMDLPPVYKHTAKGLFPKVMRRDDELVLLLDPAGITKYINIDETPVTPEINDEPFEKETDSKKPEEVASENTASQETDEHTQLAEEIEDTEFHADEPASEIEESEPAPAEAEELVDEDSLDLTSDLEELEEENTNPATVEMEEPGADEQALFAATAPVLTLQPAEVETLDKNEVASEDALESDAGTQELPPNNLLPDVEKDEMAVNLPELPDLGILDEPAEEETAQQDALEEELKEIFAEAAQQDDDAAEPLEADFELTVEDLVSSQEQQQPEIGEEIPRIDVDDDIPVLMPLEEAVSGGEGYQDLFAETEPDKLAVLSEYKLDSDTGVRELKPEQAINPSFIGKFFNNMKTRKKRKKAAKRRILSK